LKGLQKIANYCNLHQVYLLRVNVPELHDISSCCNILSVNRHSDEREGGAGEQRRIDQWRRRRRHAIRHDGLRDVVGRLHDGIRAHGISDTFQMLHVNAETKGRRRKGMVARANELGNSKGERNRAPIADDGFYGR